MLATLATTDGQVQYFLTIAEVDSVNIRWDGGPKLLWFAALSEARKQNKLVALIAAVEQEYSRGDVQELRRLAEEVEGQGAHADATNLERPLLAPFDVEVNDAGAFIRDLAERIEVVDRMIQRYREAQDARAHATALKVRARFLSFPGSQADADSEMNAVGDVSDSLRAMKTAHPVEVIASVVPKVPVLSDEFTQSYLDNLEEASGCLQTLVEGAGRADSVLKLRALAQVLEFFWNECLGGLYTRINDGIQEIRDRAARMDTQ